MERYDYNLCQVKTVLFSKVDMPAQKCSQGVLLKFQDGTFGAIKFFRKKKFTVSSTSCGEQTSNSPWFDFYFLLKS